MSIYLANGAGFLVGMTVNVILVRKLVFPDSRFRLIHDLQLSLISNGLMFLVGMGLLWLLVESLSLNVYLAKVLTNGATFLINFVIRAVYFRKN